MSIEKRKKMKKYLKRLVSQRFLKSEPQPLSHRVRKLCKIHHVRSDRPFFSYQKP